VGGGEAVLLIGETGVGKTSSLQFLARLLAQPLLVLNLNRQTDSADLLGGYKPVELKHIFSPIREEFEALFPLTFPPEPNSRFLLHVMTSFANRRWKDLLQLLTHVQKAATTKLSHNNQNQQLLAR
jgi:midasin